MTNYAQLSEELQISADLLASTRNRRPETHEETVGRLIGEVDRLRVEKLEWKRRALRAEKGVAGALGLHVPMAADGTRAGGTAEPWCCREDGFKWPCDTAIALHGGESQ